MENTIKKTMMIETIFGSGSGSPAATYVDLTSDKKVKILHDKTQGCWLVDTRRLDEIHLDLTQICAFVLSRDALSEQARQKIPVELEIPPGSDPVDNRLIYTAEVKQFHPSRTREYYITLSNKNTSIAFIYKTFEKLLDILSENFKPEQDRPDTLCELLRYAYAYGQQCKFCQQGRAFGFGQALEDEECYCIQSTTTAAAATTTGEPPKKKMKKRQQQQQQQRRPDKFDAYLAFALSYNALLNDGYAVPRANHEQILKLLANTKLEGAEEAPSTEKFPIMLDSAEGLRKINALCYAVYNDL